MALLPEMYKKFEEEGCPDWTSLYSSTIDLNDIFLRCSRSYADALKTEVEKFRRAVDFPDIEKIKNRNFEKYEEEVGENVRAVLKQKGIKTLFPSYVLSHVLLAPAFFGENLADLLNKAKNGDRKSILKLVQMDKSLIASEWSSREIRKARMAGELEYFELLSKALRTEAFRPQKRDYRLSCVLVFC